MQVGHRIGLACTLDECSPVMYRLREPAGFEAMSWCALASADTSQRYTLLANWRSTSFVDATFARTALSSSF